MAKDLSLSIKQYFLRLGAGIFVPGFGQRVERRLASCYNRAMVIDFHTHVLPPEVKKDRSRYLERDPLFATLYSSPKARVATAEELIESMDRHGVEVSVILNAGWSQPELCVETNNYILEAVERYPRRLVGFCMVPPGSIEVAVGEVERCARAGIRGVGEIRPDTQLFDLADRGVMAPLVEVMVKYLSLIHI